MTTYARIIDRSWWLFSDFGLEFAKRHFTDEQIASLGVYGPRSKHVGKPKGQISWAKVESGGWVRRGPGEGNGYVENRVGKIIEVKLQKVDWGKDPVTVVAKNLENTKKETVV